MWRGIFFCLALPGLLCTSSPLGAAQRPADDSLVEPVNKAIDAGVRFLYD